MRIITRYLLLQFLGLFALALIFFVVSLVLGDLLVNLSRMVPLNVPIAQVFYISWLYVPQAVSYALSPALLFGVAFVLGTLYTHNELIIILGSGIPLWRFTAPLFVFGLIFSIFLFFWNDQGVIPSQKLKNEMTRTALGVSSLNNTNLALLSRQGQILYTANFYNDQSHTLTGIVLVFRASSGDFQKRLDAEWADWKDGVWLFHKVRSYTFDRSGKMTYQFNETWTEPSLNEKPETFQHKNIEMGELTFREAGVYIDTLRKAGLPSIEAETDFLQRISFSFSPFVVVWISAAIGGRFKKNILLMSLLTSLLVSAAYIVLQMVFGLFSKTGFLPPWIGAMSGMVVGWVAGVILFLRART